MIRRILAIGFAGAIVFGISTVRNDTPSETFSTDYMPTRFASSAAREAHVAHEAEEAKENRKFATRNARIRSNKLVYNGGKVAVTPKVYLIFWGSQWANDPNGVAPYATNFFGGLYGSLDNWSTSTTQYCQGVAVGSVSCGTGGTKVTHPATPPLVSSSIWYDNATAAPTNPTQAQLAAEAVRAAAHFGNTTTASNLNAQYIISTAHNNNSIGFGTQWCAWHSATSSSYGNIAYVNMPYIPDADWACGADFVNPGNKLDGYSIVGGHEYVEAITDPFPISGWLDKGGMENADKCVWIAAGTAGGAKNLTLPTGTFAVQGLWSNNYGSAGGCVNRYVSATNQGS